MNKVRSTRRRLLYVVGALLVIAAVIATLCIILRPFGRPAPEPHATTIEKVTRPTVSEISSAPATTVTAQQATSTGEPSSTLPIESIPSNTTQPTNQVAQASSSNDGFPLNPLPPTVEPDNDIDAETGEAAQAPTAGSTSLGSAKSNEANGDTASIGTTVTPTLPAPLDPSVTPDNDVSAE